MSLSKVWVVGQELTKLLLEPEHALQYRTTTEILDQINREYEVDIAPCDDIYDVKCDVFHLVRSEEPSLRNHSKTRYKNYCRKC